MNRRQLLSCIPVTALAILPSSARALPSTKRPENLLLLVQGATEEETCALLEAKRIPGGRSIDTIMFPDEKCEGGFGLQSARALQPDRCRWMVGEIPSPIQQLEMAVREAVLWARDNIKASSQPDYPTYSFYDQEQEQQVVCTIEGYLGLRWDYGIGRDHQYGTIVYPDRVTAVWNMEHKGRSM